MCLEPVIIARLRDLQISFSGWKLGHSISAWHISHSQCIISISETLLGGVEQLSEQDGKSHNFNSASFSSLIKIRDLWSHYSLLCAAGLFLQIKIIWSVVQCCSAIIIFSTRHTNVVWLQKDLQTVNSPCFLWHVGVELSWECVSLRHFSFVTTTFIKRLKKDLLDIYTYFTLHCAKLRLATLTRDVHFVWISITCKTVIFIFTDMNYNYRSRWTLWCMFILFWVWCHSQTAMDTFDPF